MNDLIKLSKWERGIKLHSPNDENVFAYFWFYEWNLFEAVNRGEHTAGAWRWDWEIDPLRNVAQLNGEYLSLTVEATSTGAKMLLKIENTTDYDWPDIASIIPCLNPGDPDKPIEWNSLFLDTKHSNTYFWGKNGIELLAGKYPREIHFNHFHKKSVMDCSAGKGDAEFVFSEKWPTSMRDAYKGIILRKAEDSQWILGIAWDSYLSAQGHNPWNCMHLSVCVGPLLKGERKTLNGRIYLFKGSIADCISNYKNDFNAK